MTVEVASVRPGELVATESNDPIGCDCPPVDELGMLGTHTVYLAAFRTLVIDVRPSPRLMAGRCRVNGKPRAMREERRSRA